MKTKQYKWSQSEGWMPDLPAGGVGRQTVVFIFGARPLIQAGELVDQLRHHFKGAAILGCSTSGEIVGDTVVDDSVVATAVEFEHTPLRTASATMTGAKSSCEVGEELARQLNDPSLRHVFVLSDGLNVNGSDLSRGLASGVAEGVRSPAACPETVPTSPRPGSSPTMPPALSAWPRSVSTETTYALATHRWAVGGRSVRYAPSPAQRATCSMSSMGARRSTSTRRIWGPRHSAAGIRPLFPIVVTAAQGGEGVVRTVLSVNEQEAL